MQRKSKWAATKVTCEYHEHPGAGVCGTDEMETYNGPYAYMTADCYPVWKVQDVDRVELEKVVEAITPDEDNDMFEITDEPAQHVASKPRPRMDVTNEDTPTAKAEIAMDKDPFFIEEESKPPIR